MPYDVMETFFEGSRENGCNFALLGGPDKGRGFTVQPAIVDNPPDNSKIVMERAFW
jgi:hypothetical protein